MVTSAQQPDTRPQVLIVGAGPVGLTAAHELARRGLRVRLVDAAPEPARTSRAVATHPRTLETYDQMGVVDAMLARGRENRAFTMYARGRHLVRLEADYASMPTAYPFTLVIGQTETEAVLRGAVARLGVMVEWGVRLTALSQHHDRVHVTLEDAAGAEQSVDTPWLVGCDGGHSTVRTLLGLELIGTSSETWMLADVPVAMDLPPDTIYWAHTGQQALMMVPYAREGHWRLLDTAPPDDAAEPGRAEERLGAKLSKGLGREVTVGRSEWTSVFTFQQRMVERMGDGRVFVAGDAAHVHSPASGQGMNTGIQEAYNLAWKLALVEQGHAGAPLLDSYSKERVPVGAALLDSTRTATVLVQLRNLLAGAVLPLVFGVVRRVGPLRRAIQRKVLGGMSGLRISYPSSPLSTADGLAGPLPRTGPGPGERARAVSLHTTDPAARRAFSAELRDVRWSLLLSAHPGGPGRIPADVAVTAAAQYGEWLSVRTLGGRPDGTDGPAPHTDPGAALRTALGLRPGAWLLVRPDGYVAARGPLLTRDALRRALAPAGPPAPLADAAHPEPAPPPAPAGTLTKEH
ncbi:FAD-dependent oxidoreductase [Streptomyces sp. SID10853]|uniref:FAD-dependent oxidoreductase n=1 Tax=Streptomyces sp. SID10853 TaxID=2706028 RepID=UPI0013C00674|nr:FAD-dependent oxidoreductase [Streptomyces sp. SID10853]NDZ83204.1 FAD-dependent oxidoreductase [Streptomyces sp. SID10853]